MRHVDPEARDCIDTVSHRNRRLQVLGKTAIPVDVLQRLSRLYLLQFSDDVAISGTPDRNFSSRLVSNKLTVNRKRQASLSYARTSRKWLGYRPLYSALQHILQLPP